MIGIDYPTFVFGDRTLIVRYTLAAQVLMRRRGVEPGRLFAATAPRLHPGDVPCTAKGPCSVPGCRPNPDAVQNAFVVFSACVAENYVDQSRPERVNLDTVPSADYWATQLDVEDFERALKAIGQALSKMSEARQRRLQAVESPSESLAS
jgi:hypothetical protein